MNYNIQALRAFAAWAVVGHHLINALNDYIGGGRFDIPWQIGAKGVDVFFVISGFIMAATTAARPTTPLAFIRNRIQRIVPIYWLLTAAAIVAILAGFGIFGNASATPEDILTSLFFLPNVQPDGSAKMPILFVGWTLNYEMMFYLIFAVALVVRQVTARLVLISAAVIALWLAGQFVTGNPYLTYWSDSIITAFPMGIGVWLLTRRVQLPLAAAFALAAVGLLALAAPDLLRGQVALPDHSLLTAFGAALVVLAAVALETSGRSVGNGALKRRGDESYTLYLIHPFVLQLVGKLAVLTRLDSTPAGLVATLLLMILASGIVAHVFHLQVEVRLNDWFRQRQRPSPQLAAA